MPIQKHRWNRRRVWTALTFLVAIAGTGRLFLSLSRPSVRSVAINQSVTAPSSTALALKLCYGTKDFVTLEGGTYGGVLHSGNVKDVAALVPGMDKSLAPSESVLWLYDFVPSGLVQESSLMGGTLLRIRGRRSRQHFFCLFSFPRSMDRDQSIICMPE